MTAVAPKTESFELRVIPGGKWKDRVDADPMPYREREALRYFLSQYESDVGLKSCHFEAVSIMCGAGGGGPNLVEEHAVRLADRKSTQTANRVRRALRHMIASGQDRDVVVLNKLHGPTAPSRDMSVFGSLAMLVDMTEAVDAVRDELALQEGESRETKVGAELAQTLPEVRDHFAETFWSLVGRQLRDVDRLTRSVAQAARGQAVGRRMAPGIAELQKRVQAWPGVLAGVLERYRRADDYIPQGSLLGRLSAMASADRELTHADALRHAMAPYRGPRGPKGHPHTEAHAAWQTARDVFVSAAKTDALRLRADATRHYLVALRAKK